MKSLQLLQSLKSLEIFETEAWVTEAIQSPLRSRTRTIAPSQSALLHIYVPNSPSWGDSNRKGLAGIAVRSPISPKSPMSQMSLIREGQKRESPSVQAPDEAGNSPDFGLLVASKRRIDGWTLDFGPWTLEWRRTCRVDLSRHSLGVGG